MEKLFLECFHVEVLRDEHLQRGSKRLKRALIKQGRDHILSIYGAVYNEEGDVFQARRIEILSPASWTKDRLGAVYLFFSTHPPPYVYSIWEVDESGVEVRCLGGYN